MQARLRGIDEAAHYRRVSHGSMIVLHAEGFCSEERGGELAQFRLQLAFALLGIGRRTDLALVRGCNASFHRQRAPLRQLPLKFQPDFAC